MPRIKPQRSLADFADCKEVFDRAVASKSGIRHITPAADPALVLDADLTTKRRAIRFAHRLNQFRVRDTQQLRQIYVEAGRLDEAKSLLSEYYDFEVSRPAPCLDENRKPTGEWEITLERKSMKPKGRIEEL